ncbi:MAG: hypothetical protein WCO98_08635 [bacterium]
MFHNNFISKMTPWTITETSEWMPVVAYPALVGSGRLTMGIDCTGLQGLPDRIASSAGSAAAPFHVTQSDLYILHEGMIGEHLSRNEVMVTGKDVAPDDTLYGQRKNFMPLGYLAQTFTINGKEISGEDILAAGKRWTREWDLKKAILTNSFIIDKRVGVETEIFMPHGGESIYLKLIRKAAKGEGDFSWKIQLKLETRGGLPIFDQPGAVKASEQTLLATIDRDSSYLPNEPYTVIYGAGAVGANVEMLPTGWEISMTGAVAIEQTAYLRLDFQRLAGAERDDAVTRQQKLEKTLMLFSAGDYLSARQAHIAQYSNYWNQTADIEVDSIDALEITRRYMLHMSEYLLHCGSDFACGGSPQFAFYHQNGWGASNFHDQHYVVDGIARANMWEAAESHAHWLRRVMRETGRAFPWMMNYDGTITAPPEVDRAPMSDAGRALLAMRLYELAGIGKDTLLRDTVYPILRRVAEMAVSDWFYEHEGRMIFRGVELDVMGDNAIEHDASTVLAFLTVIRKAIEYSNKLGVDADCLSRWQNVIDHTDINVVNGRYEDHRNAPPDAMASGWLCHSYYISECQRFLDDDIYAATVDYSHRQVSCNIPWIGYAVASSEMRLGRPDRAEQYFVDHLENRLHGPGYYEECYPLWMAAVPPFESAHGSHLTAACEQIVLTDFWEPRIYIGKGMPSKFRALRVRFSNLCARDGIIISGISEPRRLAVTLRNTGDAATEEIVLSIPCQAGVTFKVLRDGAETPHDFHGEFVSIIVTMKAGEETELVVEG